MRLENGRLRMPYQAFLDKDEGTLIDENMKLASKTNLNSGYYTSLNT